ncbi:MAG: PhoX family phosphatase [Rhodospirillaceae bacterium]
MTSRPSNRRIPGSDNQASQWNDSDNVAGSDGYNVTESDSDDIASNESGNVPFAAIAEQRLSRRGVLAAMAGAAVAAAVAETFSVRRAFAAASPSTLSFAEIPHGYDGTHHVPDGYDAEILLRWGDPVETGAPAFDPAQQTAAAQARQFGYNCDFIGFVPLPAGSAGSERGLLCVNHEYTIRRLMFPGVDPDAAPSREQTDIEMAAHGHSVVEIARTGGRWAPVPGSRYNRRIHAGTEMLLAGPAAGHDRLKTSADPTGTRVLGTLNNCAGGVTPWGTVLTAEENFNGYFDGDAANTAEARNHKRYGLQTDSRYSWSRHHDRFDVGREPNEPNRFGWIVEIDPYDPESVPVKRTALGRFKHEGAHSIVSRDGRVVVYSGDDQRFDYVYRFVSSGRFNPDDRAANRALLDDGALSVAKFNADGTLDWLPLTYGSGPLTEANGFASQADVLIETRSAADLLGATPMDRPEDVEPNPVTGVVYLLLTNNDRRTPGQVDAANPRAKNLHGHIIEMLPPGRGSDADHTASRFRWEIPLLGGNPTVRSDGAKYHPAVTADGWLSAPDNCAFDARGRLWIATDGAPKAGMADGVWATDCEGEGRMLTRHFLSAPRGAELCGPCFTPDDRTLFAAIQHPADERGSTFENPSTRWPDFADGMPPRPSVIVVTKSDGGIVGS